MTDKDVQPRQLNGALVPDTATSSSAMTHVAHWVPT